MPILQWVPSKKAMAAGIVPVDYSKYDIPVDVDFEDESLAKTMKSVFVGAEKTMRHAYNNEAAAAWDAAKKREDNPLEDSAEVRGPFLDEWRMTWRTKFINGELGLRRIVVTPLKDDLTVEAELIALKAIREHAESNGAAFTYNVVNARTLAAKYGKGGQTIGEIIAGMLDREKSPNRARRIWKEAQQILDARNAAGVESDDEEDIFADEPETEDA